MKWFSILLKKKKEAEIILNRNVFIDKEVNLKIVNELFELWASES